MDWSRFAKDIIARIDIDVPEGATLKERTAIIDAAYPFGERRYWPYKAWLKARREYLGRYGYRPRPLTPIEFRLAEMPRDPESGRPVNL